MKTNLSKVQEAIAMASKHTSPKGWEKVIWANKLSAKARSISYSFNFQPRGTVTAGETRQNQWAGSADQNQGCICQAVAIIA